MRDDGRVHDPDTMVSPLSPKPTLKTESLTRKPTTIVSSLEEDTVLKVSLSELNS
jgi:hypothetical protein